MSSVSMSEIFWTQQPKWDAQAQGWYWEGQRLEATGQLKPVVIYLRPDEFGPDGYPRKDATPPPSSALQQPSSTPRSGNFDTSGSSLVQQIVDYPPSNEQLELPGPSFQSSSNYQIYDGGLNQEKPGSSTSGRRHHKRHTDRKSSNVQALPTQFETSFQQLSLQNTGSKAIPSFNEPVPQTNGFGSVNQTQVDFYAPEATPWTAGSGDAAPQLASQQGHGSSPSHSSYRSRNVSATYGYGAQVHTGARWAGGPSNGDVGLSPIRVKQNALNKIKQVPSKDILDPNFDVYPSTSFQPGKIIKVWWSEPSGMPIRGAFGSRLSKPDALLLKDHKKAIWTGFRRFIIIRNFEGHCHGIPIYTYQGQGCTKHGAKPYEHGAIYEDLPGSAPNLLPNEKTLGFPSIRARTTNGDPMDNASRVNYAKVADVGHNLMVNFIAEVVPEDWDIAKNALRKSGFC